MHGQSHKDDYQSVAQTHTDQNKQEKLDNSTVSSKISLIDNLNRINEHLNPVRRLTKKSALIRSGIIPKPKKSDPINIYPNPDVQIEIPDEVKQLLISKNYSVVEYINSGTVALVFKVHQNGQFFAAKVINKNLLSSRNERALGLYELTIMQALDHPNIIKYFDFIENNHYQVIIMEYADGSDLFNWAHRQIQTNVELVKRWFREILTGLEFLHQNGYAHRDLKVDDILIVNNVAKISDFGSATFSVNLLETFETMDEPNSTRCAIEYRAPESFNNKFNAFRGDYYACGVILYILITLQYPFAPGLDGLPDTDQPDSSILKKIMEKNWRKVEIIQRDERLYSLLRQLLNPDPQERISVEQALEHPWFDYKCPI